MIHDNTLCKLVLFKNDTRLKLFNKYSYYYLAISRVNKDYSSKIDTVDR